MIQKMLKKHKFFFVFITILFFILLFKIVFYVKPFYDWDESLYIKSGLEMFEKGYFLFPVWQGKIWFDKPPLIPFLYALVIKTFPFILPEISTRIFTLLIGTATLTLLYFFYYQVTKNTFLATLIIFLTATRPIFLQRLQVVNLDLFLLMGWIGYVLFFNQFFLSLFFLIISVFSKSLIGFYPILIMFFYQCYLFLTKEIDFKKFKKNLIKLFTHFIIPLIWFILMYIKYGHIFLKMHIFESHFRRITASIEFHFGERLFYVNLVKTEFGIYSLLVLIGIITLIWHFYKKRLSANELFFSFYLLPWFIFLNLTKTKIFWYLLPAIPQFAFFSFFSLTFLKNKKILFHFLIFVFFVFISYQFFWQKNFLGTFYSEYDSNYYLAITAKKYCSQIDILIDQKTRSDFETLDKLNLLITTSRWWGNHPSIFYYFGKKINLYFDKKHFLKNIDKYECFVLEKKDINDLNLKKFKLIKNFDSLFLYQRQNQ
jgi:4-amino-4-deoxy-L-arabinose transferase-like glycosyltransferase